MPLCRLLSLTVIFLVLWPLAAAGQTLRTETGIHSETSNQALIRALKHFLNTMPTIRVGVPLGYGMGHQSASASIVTRLRQLDFKGIIEVVYEPSQKSKLTYLFPPFTHLGPDEQEFPELKLKFFPFRERPRLPQLPLGILGAADHDYGPTDFHVTALLTLQPLLWELGQNQVEISYEIPRLRKTRNLKIQLNKLEKLGYLFDFDEMKEVSSFVRLEMNHDPGLRQKIEGLIQIFKLRGKVHLAPVYGHQIFEGFQLIKYLNAITTAIQLDPLTFENKGVVIPVFSEVSDETKEVIQSYISPTAKIAFSNIHDPLLSSRLNTLGPKEVLVIFTGKVTKRVFEQIYFSSTIPPIVEGMNSINIMQILGRPYFPSDYFTEGFHFEDKFQASSTEERAAFDLAFAAKTGITSTPRQTKRSQNVFDSGPPWGAHFILQSMDTQSAVSRLFRIHQASSKNHLYQDKLIRGLLLTQKYVKRIVRTGGFVPGWDSTCVSFLTKNAALETNP